MTDANKPFVIIFGATRWQVHFYLRLLSGRGGGALFFISSRFALARRQVFGYTVC